MSDESVEDHREALGVRAYVETRWAGAGVVPFGDEVLHAGTIEVESITDEIKMLARYMIDVMHARHGIGLAANQVGLPQRMFVHNLPRVAPQVIINPVIVDLAGTWEYTEGCLSMTLASTSAKTLRPKRLVVEALNLDGESVRISADELLARVFMHEIDHLDGLVYVQRLLGEERKRVYETMREGGVKVAKLPFRPYDFKTP